MFCSFAREPQGLRNFIMICGSPPLCSFSYLFIFHFRQRGLKWLGASDRTISNLRKIKRKTGRRKIRSSYPPRKYVEIRAGCSQPPIHSS
jgi:hypothetical protein